MYIERFASTIEWFVFVYHLYAYIVYILQKNSLDLYIYTCTHVWASLKIDWDLSDQAFLKNEYIMIIEMI